MALKTTLEQIEEVQTAISNVMSGQEASIDGKRLRFPDLNVLQNRETYLLKKYRQEQGTGGLSVNTGIPRR